MKTTDVVSLQTLPTELFDEILHHLYQISILSLSKTSKALNVLVLPHLYRKIELTWQAGNEPRIASLVRSVLSREHVAAAIEIVEFKATNYTSDDYERPSYPKKVNDLTEDDRNGVKEALDVFTDITPERAIWEKALHENDLDAIITVLLSHCKNFRSLTLGAYFLHKNRFLPTLFTHAFKKSREATATFEKLEVIKLGVDMDEYSYDDFFDLKIAAEAVLPIFYLPGLKSADMMLNWRDSRKPLPCHGSNPPQATLEHLRLRRSRVTTPAVAEVLACCPNLSAFEYDYRPIIGCDQLDCKLLLNALGQYNMTLKHLRLRLLVYNSDSVSPYDFPVSKYQTGTIGGTELLEFTNLETLEVSLAALLGGKLSLALSLADVLPRGLRTLTVRDDLCGHGDCEWADEEYITLFDAFLRGGKWKETCPHLEWINVRLDQKVIEWSKESINEFRMMATREGLNCNIQECFDEEYTNVYGTDEGRLKPLNTYFD